MSTTIEMRASTRDGNPLAALAFVIPCVVCWALIPMLANGIENTGLRPAQFLFWSNVVSTLVLFAIAWAKGRLSAFRRYTAKDVLHLIGLGGLGTFGYYALLYSAFNAQHDKPAGLIIVQYTWPVLTAILSALLLRQRTSLRTNFALVLAVAAIVIGFGLQPNSGAPGRDVLIVATAAVVFALYSFLSARRSYEPFTYMTGVFGAGSVLSLIWMLSTTAWTIPHPGPALRFVLLNGSLVNGVSYVWWLEALRRAHPSFVAPWASMTPLLGTSILFLLGTPVAPSHWTGVALIFGSILLTLPGRAASAGRSATDSEA